MQRHRRVKQTSSFVDRLASFAKDARRKALRLPPGDERDALLQKVEKADRATKIEERANSSGLQRPK